MEEEDIRQGINIFFMDLFVEERCRPCLDDTVFYDLCTGSELVGEVFTPCQIRVFELIVFFDS